MSTPETLSGPAEAERRAQEHAEHLTLQVEQAHGEALGMDHQFDAQKNAEAKVRTIEERASSPEVQALNDLAELEIYGSRGRTYKDPQTGDVIANKDHPIRGLLEEMREEPHKMLGRPQSERDEAAAEREKEAQKYEKAIKSLMQDKGLELCQAKIVMDLRTKDRTENPKLTSSLQEDGGPVYSSKGGYTELTPRQKSNELYKKLDAKRIELIKKEGAFTPEEYKKVRAGENLYDIDNDGEGNGDHDGSSESSESSEAPTDELQVIEEVRQASRDALSDQAGIDMLRELGEATNEYVTTQSKLEKSLASFGKNKPLKAAQERYEAARVNVNKKIASHLQSLGYTAEEVTDELIRQNIGQNVDVKQEGNGWVEVQDGEEGEALWEKSRGESGLIRDLTRRELTNYAEYDNMPLTDRQKRESRFLAWWTKHKGAKGALAYAGVTMPVAIAARAAVAPAVVGGAMGIVRAKLNSREDVMSKAEERSVQRHLNQIDEVEAEIQEMRDDPSIDKGSVVLEATNVTGKHHEGAREVQRKNRNKAIISGSVGAAIGAGAGVLASEVSEKIGDLTDGGSNNSSGSGDDDNKGTSRGGSGGADAGDRGEGAGEDTGAGDGGDSGDRGEGAGEESAEASYHNESLTNGDTISHHALSHLQEGGNSSPSQAQIMAETQRILDLNNLDWDEARELSAGYTFKV